MERLAKTNINTAEEYDRIFRERAKKSVDEFDLKRWKYLLRFYKGGKLIDLGCLDSLVPVLAKLVYGHAEVWGIDQTPDAIAQLAEKHPDVVYQVADLYHTKLPSNYFNYAVAGEVIEHMERPTDFLCEAFRILKPGGILALSTPLNEAIEPGAVDADRHLWSFTKQDIRELLSPFGTVLRLKKLGSQYVPIYKYHFPNIVAFVKKHAV